jgi:hypothetical protein
VAKIAVPKLITVIDAMVVQTFESPANKEPAGSRYTSSERGNSEADEPISLGIILGLS